MPEYLSKEEIKQWRSSLERITLEEYAQRLGKVISEEKETNDIIDKVMKKSSFSDDMTMTPYQVKTEKISSLARQSFEREQEIRDIREILAKPVKKEAPKHVSSKTEKKETKMEVKAKSVAKEIVREEKIASGDVQITFKKNLTPREQAVFEHFLNNKNSIVYAKELAQILELPRDYVYKYIKNLRAKINEDALQNAENGGFILQV